MPHRVARVSLSAPTSHTEGDQSSGALPRTTAQFPSAPQGAHAVDEWSQKESRMNGGEAELRSALTEIAADLTSSAATSCSLAMV